LIDGDRGTLVDTGVAAHEEEILRQLEELLPVDARLSVFLTRAELDCLGNLAAIAGEFHVDNVLTGGVVNPFDAFDHATSLVPETVRFARGADVTRIAAGPGHELVVLQPKLRLLATFWLYDEETRTMFTSDAFGHRSLEVDGPPIVADHDVAAVDRSIRAKFDWLTECARVDEVAGATEAAFRMYPTERIAPGHGCVLAGKSCVAAHVDGVLDVLVGYA
jgi:flavorubredoxin